MANQDGQTGIRENETMAEVSQAAKHVADQVGESGEQLRSAVNQGARQLKSQVAGSTFNESTVPDLFRSAPKFISPKVHAWLDAAVTTYFLGVGAWFAMRGKRGPATAAFINAGMVAGVSMLTDYNGTGNKPISLKLHGTLDAVQAATAASCPLFGFAGKPGSALFYGQAANELLVIASTDWEAGMPGGN